MSARTLLAVDGNSLLHRSFHANARTGFALADGRPAWAVRGLLSQLAAAVDRSCADAIVVGFDDPDTSHRRQRWPVYKAQRDPKLAGFNDQLWVAVEMLRRLGVVVCVPPGLEADDVLASTCVYGRTHGWQVVLATSDRDAFSLVDDNTRVLRILNGGVEASPMLTPQRLELVAGVPPAKYRDLAALRGDPSDNLPGVRGIGPRKAVTLLTEFGCGAAIFDDAAAGGQRCARVVGAKLTARLAEPESRRAWEFNRAVMAMHDDLPLGLDPDEGIGRLPLDQSRVAEIFDLFGMFLPNGLRALAATETPPPRAIDLDPAWQPWRRPSTPRFPPLRAPAAPRAVQDALF